MIIKQYDSSILPGVLELFNSAMELDSFTADLLEENLTGDEDYRGDLTLTAYEEGILVGFIMGVIRTRKDETTGYIKLLCVKKEMRRRGIATELYNQVEKIFKSEKINKMRVYESYPNYYMPGIDPFYTEAVCFFERIKFKKIGDCSNLEADLTTQDFATINEESEVSRSGIEIRRAEPDDFEAMIEWTKKHFEAWKSEVNNSFKNNPISLHVALTNNNIIAFSAYDTNNTGMAWFGPMGTTPEARGNGIGGILLKRCLADQKKEGFKKAIIPWVGPIPFYLHYVNSKVKRVFWRYEKVLEEN